MAFLPMHTYPLDANLAGAQISADSFSSLGRPTYPAEVLPRSHPGFGRRLERSMEGVLARLVAPQQLQSYLLLYLSS